MFDLNHFLHVDTELSSRVESPDNDIAQFLLGTGNGDRFVTWLRQFTVAMCLPKLRDLAV